MVKIFKNSILSLILLVSSQSYAGFSFEGMGGFPFSGTYNGLIGGKVGYLFDNGFYVGTTYNRLFGATSINQFLSPNIISASGSFISGSHLATADIGYRILVPVFFEIMPYLGFGTMVVENYNYTVASGVTTSGQTIAQAHFLMTFGAKFSHNITDILLVGIDNRFTGGPTSFQYLLSGTVGVRF